MAYRSGKWWPVFSLATEHCNFAGAGAASLPVRAHTRIRYSIVRTDRARADSAEQRHLSADRRTQAKSRDIAIFFYFIFKVTTRHIIIIIIIMIPLSRYSSAARITRTPAQIYMFILLL